MGTVTDTGKRGSREGGRADLGQTASRECSDFPAAGCFSTACQAAGCGDGAGGARNEDFRVCIKSAGGADRYQRHRSRVRNLIMACLSLTLPQPPNRVMPRGGEGGCGSGPRGRDGQRVRSGGSERRGSRSACPDSGDSIMANSDVRPKYRTKKDIVRVISERLGAPQMQTKDLVEMTFEALIETLAQQGRVELRNFGIFQVRHLPARTARNPRTGESVLASAKNVVVFKPGKEMAERIQDLGNQFALPETSLDQDESGEPDGFAP